VSRDAESADGSDREAEVVLKSLTLQAMRMTKFPCWIEWADTADLDLCSVTQKRSRTVQVVFATWHYDTPLGEPPNP
jgi:hypothetical protein